MTSRVAFVTGASRGIGRATAVALASAGHRVAVGYTAGAVEAETTLDVVRAAGGEAVALRVDVREPESLDAAFGAVEKSWGPVEILVNNAGVTRDGLVARMDDQQWAEVLDVNLTGSFHAIRRATPRMMRARFGRIVNVSSVAAFGGAAGQANYAASKAGLVGLTRAVARELAPRSITCNAVLPGPVDTDMTAELPDERRAALVAGVPLGRFGTPEEVAAVVTFMTSDAASYVTGSVVAVDGGLAMGH